MLQTPLHQTHKNLGGRLVEFAGWELPVMYSGVIEEHLAVRTKTGLFDTSHMGRIVVAGNKAAEFLQRLTVNYVHLPSPWHCQYNLFCLPSGGVIDDFILLRRPRDFYLVVNAANRLAVLDWLAKNKDKGVSLTDETQQTAMLSLQGPLAQTILGEVLHLNFATWRRNDAASIKWRNYRLLVSYTGYTGEAGLEIVVPARGAREIWECLAKTGGGYGLKPCGLGARDTLRLEAGLPLYGHELTRQITPFEAGLGWVVKLSKGDFIGREALLRQKEGRLTRRLIGLRLKERAIPRAGYELISDGQRVGWVTSGNWAPYLNCPLAMAYYEGQTVPAETLGVRIRDQVVTAQVVKLPFYRRQPSAETSQYYKEGGR